MLSRSKRQGFTLIELLVVVAIISVLITILLPSLNRAKVTANRTKCAAILKSWATAIHTYSTQNDGYINLSGNASGSGPGAPSSSMFNAVAKDNLYVSGNYFGNKNVQSFRTCPMATNQANGPLTYSSQQGYNSNILPAVPAVTDFKVSNVNHPASYLIMMDGIGNIYPHSCANLFTNATSGGNLVNNEATHPSGPLYDYLYQYANTLFLDGHATQDATEALIRSKFVLTPTTGGEIKLKEWSYLRWPV